MSMRIIVHYGQGKDDYIKNVETACPMKVKLLPVDLLVVKRNNLRA